MAEAEHTDPKQTRKKHKAVVIGDRFGHLTVIGVADPYIDSPRGRSVPRWRLQCDCGTVIVRQAKQLRGQSKDCGCSRRYKPIPIGTVFGQLTVIGPDEIENKMHRVPCQCSCGRKTMPFSGCLIRGESRSCGQCQPRVISEEQKSLISAANTTHGMTGTAEYEAWASMVKRCHNPKAQAFRNYGGRGIHVCREWRESFPAFLDHIGPRPRPDLTLDRIDNDRGYEPGNVRWADCTTQARNRRTPVR